MIFRNKYCLGSHNPSLQLCTQAGEGGSCLEREHVAQGLVWDEGLAARCAGVPDAASQKRAFFFAPPRLRRRRAPESSEVRFRGSSPAAACSEYLAQHGPRIRGLRDSFQNVLVGCSAREEALCCSYSLDTRQ